MSNEIIWMLSTAVTLMIGMVSSYVSLIRQVAAISERVRVLEVLFGTLGEKAARALHRDTDPWGLDPLLDKYLNRHYELTYDEWTELRLRCQKVQHDSDATPTEKFFAGFLEAVTMHKLNIVPPYKPEPKTK